jgi:hypothetical protein
MQYNEADMHRVCSSWNIMKLNINALLTGLAPLHHMFNADPFDARLVPQSWKGLIYVLVE